MNDHFLNENLRELFDMIRCIVQNNLSDWIFDVAINIRYNSFMDVLVQDKMNPLNLNPRPV